MDQLLSNQEISCEWCAFMVPRTSARQTYCNDRCRKDAKNAKERAKRAGVPYMPQCMRMDMCREQEARFWPVFKKWLMIQFAYMKLRIQTWLRD